MADLSFVIKKSDRIGRLIDHLYEKLPVIEGARARLITESYKATEGENIMLRRAKAFEHILKNIPIVIRDEELIVGSTTIAPRGCQTYPEFSYEWLETEFDTVETRAADPFYISEGTKKELKEANAYWKGKTSSELAYSYMSKEARLSIEHNIFTVGNYFYNGIGHICVHYDKILEKGFKGLALEAAEELSKCEVSDADYAKKTSLLSAMILSCNAAVEYAHRYAALALDMAGQCKDEKRKEELLLIAKNCSGVPEHGASNFYEACQSFWFVQQLIQIESSGHSISPGRFDQYMYPYYKESMEKKELTQEFAQELLDCIWVKLNDLNKCRDAASAEGFAGYSLFQNLIVGGQDEEGLDATNDLSYMCIEASLHVQLPQPSLSIRVWNGSPHSLLLKAASLTGTGVGLPAYYNDEVVIPSLLNRGLSLKDARDYCIIGCVEPQKAGKTDGWHDAAFFNMCRPLEMVFSNGVDKGVKISPSTGDVAKMKSFDELMTAYKVQMEYFIKALVNADNAIDVAHSIRVPLPFLSSMVDNCMQSGLSVQEGGAVYNFTGPQGFGIANMADALYAIKILVFEQKKYSMEDFRDALIWNYGRGFDAITAKETAQQALTEARARKESLSREDVAKIVATVLTMKPSVEQKQKFDRLFSDIESLPKFGNDIDEIDSFAREVAYIYTQAVERYSNPRGGKFQAGLYPVSANVPLGAQTGATPDARLAHTPVADGVSPASGRDANGPTAAANSVSKLDHYIASNGTLFNQKFHPSALSSSEGLSNFVALIRAYFDQKGSHMQFNVVSKETLLDAQKYPEKYKHLVVRVAGYSALFTTLSRSLQDDIINRTEHTDVM